MIDPTPPDGYEDLFGFDITEEYDNGVQSKTVIDRFVVNGRPCVVCRVQPNGHYTGYAQTVLPDDIPYELSRHVEVHGGISHGPDSQGVVGFDTGHAWDSNVDEDGNPTAKLPELLSEIPTPTDDSDQFDQFDQFTESIDDDSGHYSQPFALGETDSGITWDPQRVHDALADLAEQLDELEAAYHPDRA